MILFNAYSINLFVILPVLLVIAAITPFLSALIRRATIFIGLQIGVIMILFNAYSINLFVILPALLVIVAIALFLSALISRATYCIDLQKTLSKYDVEERSKDLKMMLIKLHALKITHFFNDAIRLLVLLLVGATVAFCLGQYISENSPGYITIGLFIAYLISLFIEVKRSSILLGEDGGEIIGDHGDRDLSTKTIRQLYFFSY